MHRRITNLDDAETGRFKKSTPFTRWQRTRADMDHRRQDLVDFQLLLNRHVARNNAELMNSIASARAQNAKRLRSDALLVLLRIHAQHRLAQHNRRGVGGQLGLVGHADHDRNVRLLWQLPCRPPHRLDVTFHSDVPAWLPFEESAGR